MLVNLKEKMIKDNLGQIILEEDDLIDRLMTDPNNPITQGFTKNINLEPIKELIDELPNFTDYKLLDIDVETFDKTNQTQWLMPEEYYQLDIAQWVLDHCKTQSEMQRCGEELLLFQERDLFNLLRYLKYLVDIMKKNNIIWGVGRGSSVSSYVLYLLKVHQVDSLYYDLPIDEFLR